MKSKAETWHGKDMPLATFSPMAGGGGRSEGKGDGLPRPYRPEGKLHTRYPKELKLHVILEALKERIPQGELGAMYGIPQSLISIWKKAAVEAIRSNIHYKQRKRREALGLVEDPAQDEDSDTVAPGEAAQQLCQILRVAARQIERDPAVLEHLVGQGLAD